MPNIRNNASLCKRVPAWDEASWSEDLQIPKTEHLVMVLYVEQHAMCTFSAGVTCS